jgi:dihydroorotate dehydrogenase
VIDLKKGFYIFVFFIIAGGIFYFAENLNPKNGVTIGELVQLVNGDTKTGEVEIEEGLEDIKNENILEENKFSPFVSIGKSLQGKAKELYESIVVTNYDKDNFKFLKLASNLKPEELSRLYDTLTENNIDKSSIIEGIQNTIKDNSLSKEQKDKLSQLINRIK